MTSRTVSLRCVVACLALAVTFAAATTLSAEELGGKRPEVPPGSTPVAQGSERFYLTRADFDETSAYFRAQLGEPLLSGGQEGDASSRRNVFTYRTESRANQTTRYTCVRVQDGNSQSAIPSILQELRGAVRRGLLTEQRYEEIAEDYQWLSRLFFVSSDDLGGPERTVDTEIVRRYRRFLQFGLWMDPEELTQQMTRMAARGDEEGLARLEEMMVPDFKRAQEMQTTTALVDHWLECLEEIAELSETYGFPVEIDMEHTVTLTDDHKG
ncbi:MAG: hypothetical protein ACOC2D_14945 [Spirochaetota bacterium]